MKVDQKYIWLCSVQSHSILLCLLLTQVDLPAIYFLILCAELIVTANSLSLSASRFISPVLESGLALGLLNQLNSVEITCAISRPSLLRQLAACVFYPLGYFLSEPGHHAVRSSRYMLRSHVCVPFDSPSRAPNWHVAAAACHVCEPSWMFQPSCTSSWLQPQLTSNGAEEPLSWTQ